MKKPVCLNPIRFAFKRAGAETVYNEIVAPFFRRASARAYVAGNIATNLAVVGAGVYMNTLYGKFLDHLNTKDASSFTGDIGSFLLCGLLLAAAYSLRSLNNARLNLSWRDWARTRMIKSICSADRRGCFVHAPSSERTQTGQRIVEDTASMIGASTFLVGEGVRAAADVTAFSFVLCALSPAVWAGVTGAFVVGLVVSRRWSKKLQAVDKELARYANDFRNAIVATADNKQAIELWRGEEAEIKGLVERQNELNKGMRRRISLATCLDALTSATNSASNLIPYGLGGTEVLKANSAFSIGKLTETVGAARFLTDSASWFLYAVAEKNYWVSTVGRLEGFLTRSKEVLPEHQMPSYAEGSVGVAAHQLAVTIKNGVCLCELVDFSLSAGDRLALTGGSGSGKSTLLRQLAGVMPIARGGVTYTGLSEPSDALFVPQESYIPDFSMAGILSYPRASEAFAKEKMAEALEEVGLKSFQKYLEDGQRIGASLAQEMSGGEKQRLNFARLLLHKPKIIGLDEATSSLPKADGLALYKLLIERLPESIIISTIHRRELVALHMIEGSIQEKKWTLAPVRAQDVLTSLPRELLVNKVS